MRRAGGGPPCVKRSAWASYDDWAKGAHATLFCAESKHALYHSDDECDGGGWLDTDDCPNNEYDMREWKEGLLQNVGNASSHAEFDTTFLSPGSPSCSLAGASRTAGS